MLSKWNSSPDLTHLVGTGPHCCPRDPNPEEADDDGWMDGWMLKLCSEVEFFRSTLNGATPGTRSLRPGEPGKLRKMCPERDASALSGFIPPWERQRFNTHSFRQQNSELCAGAALRGTTRTAGTCLRLLSNGGGGGAHCDRSCGNGISLKHKTWSLSPSVQSVSVMKATLLVLLLSAVAVMLTCDHQHSEREAGPGCPLGKRLAFDLNTTLEESKRLNNEYFDCPNPEPGAPCFYYSHVRALFFHQMTMTVVQTILICYIGHTCWRLKRKTVYTKTRDGLDEQEGHEQFNAGWCLSAVNSCLLVFYVLEALFKILIQGRTYFRNPWNDLDFFILLMTLLDFVLSLVQSGGGFSNLDVSLAEIEEEFYKEALRHASSDGKHSKRKIELTKRYLQLLAAMDQHAQKYRSQACLLDKLVETFFMDQDEETRSDAVE
ncbi:hypothetical protein SRHO_G00342160 [Serrasalmus rhombeus]